eukprot:gnl/TRDRNA2_/TRDRNA2_200074_c0_seq1.p1 gnl/TRDRNA2_/TRDRNA2_200074_c0~~gnl/TRDRNA2_/TRDRNA2_200074_c0_seq1.p1  ORF type:complete len:338 (-),score=40.52 gnl/TRDRNA2_/TRDRNA2_200074_c0_seq1:110-1078(-)
MTGNGCQQQRMETQLQEEIFWTAESSTSELAAVEFEEMERELLDCVALEAQHILGPLRSLSRGAAGPFHVLRTGLGGKVASSAIERNDTAALRPQPVVSPRTAARPAACTEEDEAFARRLQADFDAESAYRISQARHSQSRGRHCHASREETDSRLWAIAESLVEDSPLRRPTRHSRRRAGSLPSRARASAAVGQEERMYFAPMLRPRPRGQRPPGSVGPWDDMALEDVMNRVLEASTSAAARSFAVPGACAEAVACTTTTMDYDGCGDGEAKEECNICCEAFSRGERLRVLPCLHRFHCACVDRWLAQSRTCPVCKHDITR